VSAVSLPEKKNDKTKLMAKAINSINRVSSYMSQKFRSISSIPIIPYSDFPCPICHSTIVLIDLCYTISIHEILRKEGL
ncbi:MAG TPA: hypothetical protein VI423_08640, partial [Paenisporosarcina sp.]|nr:hypothetical protein [Paenisporosarcina sp.]